MATPAEKIADALEKMNAAEQDGIVRASSLTRTYLSRLVKTEFLQPVLRGWYFVTTPAAAAPGSTAWYGHYWSFLRQYLEARFGDTYCLLPEASLHLLTGVTTIPRQLALMQKKPGQQILKLPLGTSLYIYQDRSSFPKQTTLMDSIRVMELAEALQRVPEAYFRSSPDEAALALRLVRDPTPLLRDLLENGRSVVAGRLAGAFRQVGDEATANRILQTLRSAGYDVREVNPFAAPVLPAPQTVRTTSPYVARLHAMWAKHRDVVEDIFPLAPGKPENAEQFLLRADETYVQDAYHSLSIEGYRVSPELIEKIRRGSFDPESGMAEDKSSADALAARGYLEAFNAVKTSVTRIISGEQAAVVLRADHPLWYQALFAPSVQAGLLPATALAGYRAGQVYIRGSRHVPLPAHAVSDAMDALFTLIGDEENVAVQAVLGHFLFVFIHPYSDGNGRIARFLMNALFASGGYPWTIVHVENRSPYMTALEAASVDSDIAPFAGCIRSEMEQREKGKADRSG